jgi:hypothetical protein
VLAWLVVGERRTWERRRQIEEARFARDGDHWKPHRGYQPTIHRWWLAEQVAAEEGTAPRADAFSASLSRSLRRLEERELLTRRSGYWTRIRLTDAGREAGEEVLRRVHDGRYSLTFETLAAVGDSV